MGVCGVKQKYLEQIAYKEKQLNQLMYLNGQLSMQIREENRKYKESLNNNKEQILKEMQKQEVSEKFTKLQNQIALISNHLNKLNFDQIEEIKSPKNIETSTTLKSDEKNSISPKSNSTMKKNVKKHRHRSKSKFLQTNFASASKNSLVQMQNSNLTATKSPYHKNEFLNKKEIETFSTQIAA